MPSSVVVAAIAGAASGAGAWLAGGQFLFSWGAFASSLVLNGLSRALPKKPAP
jgi:hypothetical protein